MIIATSLLICLAPRAIDGDSIACPDKTSIRLYGVNSVDGTPLDTEAKNVLAGLITGGLICEPKGTSYSRIVAVCRNGSGADIGKALIDNHLASEWCSFSVSKQYPMGYYGTCS